MRAVSLSNTRVIALLNQYFIPVYISNEDYRDKGSAPADERAELRRIHREGHEKKLSVGSVHAYVLGPDGHLLNSLHTVQVAKPQPLIALLERTTQELGTRPGEPVVKPKPQPAPKAEADSVLLHLTARYLERKGEEFQLTGQSEDAGGDWSTLPSEDWITLPKAEWAKLLPPAGTKVGESWSIEQATASRLLKHFYPPTENWDLATNRIDEQALTATLEPVQKGIARVRLHGTLKMKHPFYHKDDEKFVEASLVGFIDLEPKTRLIRSLRIVTDTAHYGDDSRRLPFGVAVRSVP